MNQEGLGLVGGLTADRPIVSTLVLAFGLTALAAIGADAAGGAGLRAIMIDFLLAGGAIAGVPLIAASFAPSGVWGRLGFALGVAALAAAVILVQPVQWLAAPAAFAAAIAASTALAVILIAAYPAFGALTRLGFLPLAAALLGTAGAIGFAAVQGQSAATALGPAAGLALTLGAVTGFAAVADFVAEFARGADRRNAAGRAAQEGVGPAAFVAVLAASAFGLLSGATANEGLAAAGLAGAGVLLASSASLVVTAAALSLRRTSEMLAADENCRRQSFRQYWRPIRRALSPAAANAVVAIAAIAVMAIALNLKAPISIALVVFIVVAGACAGLFLFSLRAGLFVFFSLLVSVVVVKWLWRAGATPDISPTDEAAALAFAAALFGQLALAWREARSPRLNARETAEAAMSGAFRLYAVSALVGVTVFFAMSVGGVWQRGGLAAAEAGMLATVGLVLGPALMTVLSNAVRRELA